MKMPNTFEVPVVGVTFQPTYPAAFSTLHDGDTVSVTHDANNSTDPNALQVECPKGIILGYVPALVARRLAPEIDAGEVFSVTIRLLVNSEHAERPGAMLHFTKVKENA